MSLVAPSARSTSSQNRAAQISPLLASMTLEEKASMLAGVDDWHFRGIPRLNIPSVKVTDCGHGVTLVGKSSPATCFPTGIGMAATWNEALLEKAGRALGRETRALGCSIMLGPKINLHRHPLNGRSFETFSEDPWLAGCLGGAVIRGLQAEGVGACVKAMAANNQQKNQDCVSAEVDERTLRELYLRAFEIAIERGQPCAIMTAYNRLNGDYTSESNWLIQHIIKDEWKFPGFVVSDWRAVHDPKVYGAGLDLEMPGPGKVLNQDGVLQALKDGLLTEAELDDKAGRILRAITSYGMDDRDEAAIKAMLDSPENRATALEVAEECIVLLKNENNVLPFDKASLRSILVIGPNAADARLGGGGSASVTPFYTVSPLQGIQEVCGSDVEVRYMEGCSLVGTMEPICEHLSHENERGERVPGMRADFFNAPQPGGEPCASWSVPRVEYSWGWASPGLGVNRGTWSVRFSGWVTPPVTGKYRIGIHAQEGCVDFRIDGESVIAVWDDEERAFDKKSPVVYFTLEREFKAGVPVHLELSYGKRTARAGLRLEWEIPGMPGFVEKAVDAARVADAVVVCAGLSNFFEGGARDRDDIDVPLKQREFIEKIANVNPRTVVVLNNGGPLAMPFENQVPALIEAWYPGQEGGRALARILFGLTNPSGRLPDTLARKLEDHAAIRNYPGDGQTVVYEEGLFVGYRHFDAAGIVPHYPFGFGLSYTTFEIESPTASSQQIPADGQVVIKTAVVNTGERWGKEVVQLYVRPVNPKLARPVKELRAFRKVELGPGEKVEVNFSIGTRELETFDPESSAWRVEPGNYEILVGDHSRSLKGVTISVR